MSDDRDERDLFDLLDGIADTLTDIVQRLERIEAQMSATDDEISSLTSTVAQNTTVDGSVATLLTGLSTQLAAALASATNAGATPAQLAQLTALGVTLDTNNAALKAAVVANTPVATVPPGATPITPA
jgi:alkylhydroperoxidase/carboxymuconolactone decarboxylase family protein YurZ